MFWNFQAWHIIVNIKHSEQRHKMYCEVTEILCQDFSRDLTLCYDNAKRWRMPVTHGLLLSCAVGISLAICFCICIFLLLFKYNGILGLYQDEFFSWLSINELCFSFYFLLGLTHASKWTTELHPKSFAIKFYFNINWHFTFSWATWYRSVIRWREIYILSR